MRCIDADEIKLPQGFFEKVDNVPKFYEWLSTLPTVDAVPVVRCKDCKHRLQIVGIPHGYSCKTVFREVTLDDFCSWGERRGDGDVV